jgi:hypothetical protein
MAGKCQAQHICSVLVDERSRNQLLVRENVRFGAGYLDPQTGAGAITEPARWCDCFGSFVGF